MYLCAAISKLLIMKRLFISLLAVAMVASGFAAETTLDFSKGTLFCSRFQKKTHIFPRVFFRFSIRPYLCRMMQRYGLSFSLIFKIGNVGIYCAMGLRRRSIPIMLPLRSLLGLDEDLIK